MGSKARHLYKFGPFCLDAMNGVLLCNGEEVSPQLQPKAIDVLLVLIESCGDLVERDDLLQKVWPDTFVNSANLDTHIKQIRKALGDDPKEPRYVKTFPKRGHRFLGGYQFIAPVREVGRESSQIDQITAKIPSEGATTLGVKATDLEEKPSRPPANELEATGQLFTAGRAMRALWPTLDFKPEIGSYSADFTGRTWLLNELDEWLKLERRRVIVIVGEQGIGKSAIAAWLSKTRSEFVVGIHFCTNKKPSSLKPHDFVANLVAQFRVRVPGFADVIESRYPDIRYQFAGEAFRELIVEPMWRVAVPPEPRLLIIDSLDTAITHIGETILDVLIKHVEDLPPWLRIVATSKPDPPILSRIEHFRVFDLDAHQNDNRKDVGQYLRAQLERPSLIRRAGKADESILKRLDELVAGNFQCARVVQYHLEDGTLRFSDLNRLSPGLARVYSFLFKWRFRDKEEYRHTYEPLLQVLVAAREQLTISLLRQVCGEGAEVVCEHLRELEAYLDPRQDRETEFRQLHPTVTEWLTDARQSGPYFVEVRCGHERLATIGWSEFKRGVSEMSAYAVAHLPVHLANLGRWEDLLNLISSRELGLLSTWIDQGEGDVGLLCLEGVVKYLEGQNQLVEAAGFATQIAQIHSQRGSYKKAAHWLKYALHRTSCWRGRRERAIALHELGTLSLYRARYRQAETAYRSAFRLCTYGFPRYPNESAANLVALATVSLETFKLKRTIRLARRAIHKAQLGSDVQHLLAAVRLMAAAYRRLGKYNQANSDIESSITTSEAVRANLEKVRLLSLRGWVQIDEAILRQEPTTEAAASFHESLAEAERIKNYYGIMEAEFGLAWCAFGGHTGEVAADRLRRVGNLLPSQPYLGPRAGYLLGLAKVMHLDGDMEASSAKCQDAIDFCRRYQIFNWEAWALVELGTIHWDTGDPARAEATWREAFGVGSRISPAFVTLTQTTINSCRTNARAH